MRNLKLTVAYDGTHFHGFQRQGPRSLRTVQQTLEEAWERLVGESIRLSAAGRTDAGVHAWGQVVNFRTASESIPTERVPYALNSVLPDDVAVRASEEAPGGFHARYDAVSKEYVYAILNQPFPSPVDRLYTYFVAGSLDIDAMREGARHLLGEHDFSAFSGNNGSVRSTVRSVYACDIVRSGARIEVRVTANGFLYHMVRNIVGTLLVVGRKEAGPEWVRRVLQSGLRSEAGPTAPAHGLALCKVEYEERGSSTFP